MGIRVLKGGMMTTVQDLGRTGYQSQGFSVSGVMDVRSFKIANLLLDNPENEAVLEFTLIGPTLEFTSETIISITGGDFRWKWNFDELVLLEGYKTRYYRFLEKYYKDQYCASYHGCCGDSSTSSDYSKESLDGINLRSYVCSIIWNCFMDSRNE